MSNDPIFLFNISIMSSWNQFVRQSRGQGLTMTQLSAMYRQHQALASQWGGGDPDKTWTKYVGNSQFIERLKRDQSLQTLGLISTATGTPDLEAIKTKVFQSDPTPGKKYLEWILDGYVNGGNHLMEDVMVHMSSALQKFVRLRNAKKFTGSEGNILDYCGLFGCQKKKTQPGLLTLLDRFEDAPSVREQRTLTKKEAEVVYEDEKVTIIHPKTQQASCLYGKGTRWCTAAQTAENRFEAYNARGPLYIIVPKDKSPHKYQLHIDTRSFMDENDSVVKLSTFPYIESVSQFLHQLNPPLEVAIDPLLYLYLKGGIIRPETTVGGRPLLFWLAKTYNSDEYDIEDVERSLSYLLKSGMDINSPDPDGNTVLHLDLEPEMVDLLLKYGADARQLNRRGQSVFYGQTRSKAWISLLDHGANPKVVGTDGKKPFDPSIMKDYIHFGLVSGIVSERPDLLDTLIQMGANIMVEDYGCSVLCEVTTSGGVEQFLKHGLNPNYQSKYGTPLHHAVQLDSEGASSVVLSLLKGGANPNLTDSDGRTPLHRARSPEVAKILMDHEANPLIQDEDGRIPANTVYNPPTKQYIYQRMGLPSMTVDEISKEINRYVDLINRSPQSLMVDSYYRDIFDLLSTPAGHRLLETDPTFAQSIRSELDQMAKRFTDIRQYYSSVFGETPPTPTPRSQTGGRTTRRRK